MGVYIAPYPRMQAASEDQTVDWRGDVIMATSRWRAQCAAVALIAAEVAPDTVAVLASGSGQRSLRTVVPPTRGGPAGWGPALWVALAKEACMIGGEHGKGVQVDLRLTPRVESTLVFSTQ